MLLLLVAVFVLPFAVGSGLFWSGWRPARFANHGELLQPPRALPEGGLRHVDGHPLPTAELRGRWLLLRVTPTPCDAACADDLQQMRQLHVALNKEQSRVRTMLLGEAMEPDGDAVSSTSSWTALHHRFPDLALARLTPDAEGAAWQHVLDSHGRTFYLVDPLGNVMMRYTDPPDLRGTLKDLERLLKYSWIR